MKEVVSFHGVVRMAAACLGLAAFLCLTEAHGGEAASQEPDPLALATLLIKDGHFDRAQKILDGMSQEQVESDEGLYHSLQGVVALQQRQLALALKHLALARQLGHQEPYLPLFLAQAHFGLGQAEAALKELERCPAQTCGQPGGMLLRAQCLASLGRRQEAFMVLQRGAALFPQEVAFTNMQVLLLLDLGLYQQAVEEGYRLAGTAAGQMDQLVLISEALLKARQFEKAVVFLEYLLLKHPADQVLVRQLVRAYAMAGKPLSAGLVLRNLALTSAEYLHDAAELFRQGGVMRQALWLNSQVPDQRAKIRQRLSLLIDMGRFEEVATMEQKLRRLGLLQEGEVAYALAYANFKNGQYDRAGALLRGIGEKKLFEKVVELKRVLEICQQHPWECE